jgi:hypothetical protein
MVTNYYKSEKKDTNVANLWILYLDLLGRTQETHKNLLQNYNHAVLEYVLGVVLQHGDKEIY